MSPQSSLQHRQQQRNQSQPIPKKDNDSDDEDDESIDESHHHSHHVAVTNSTLRYALCAALNSCNLGYDLGVSTNAAPLLAQDFALSNRQLELFLGSLNFWSIFGALISPVVTDRYGRRATFAMAALGFLGGIALQATATSFVVLMVGRFLVGLGVGVGEAIDPMYIAEIAPKSQRGRLVSWAEAGVATGVVLGFSSSLLLQGIADSLRWRFMLGLGAILPLVMLVLLWKVMPESPRWLVAQQQEAQARVILETIVVPPETVQDVIDDIQDSLRIEQLAGEAVGWAAIFAPSPAVRRMLVVGVSIAIIQQAVGIDSVMFYLLYVIQGTGIQSEFWQTISLIVLGAVKLAFVFVGAHLFDKQGRRPLLFISLLGCAASLFVVSLTFISTSQASQCLTIVGLASYLAFFSSGLGPGNWVVVSEIFATSIRAKAMSVAVLPNRITATIMASTFLSLANLLTWPGFFMLLTGICLASAAFLFVYLPETKGKSLEEMAVYFAEITGDRSILDVEQELHRQNGHHSDTCAQEKNTQGIEIPSIT